METIVEVAAYIEQRAHVYQALNQDCRRYCTAKLMGKKEIVKTWRPRVTFAVPTHTTYSAAFRRTYNERAHIGTSSRTRVSFSDIAYQRAPHGMREILEVMYGLV